jgi:hypothetical protein
VPGEIALPSPPETPIQHGNVAPVGNAREARGLLVARNIDVHQEGGGMRLYGDQQRKMHHHQRMCDTWEEDEEATPVKQRKPLGNL